MQMLKQYTPTIKKLRTHLQWALAYLEVLRDAEEEHLLNYKLVQIFYWSIFNDYIRRCLMAFEMHSKSARSFWYLEKHAGQAVIQSAKRLNVDLDEVREMSKKLKVVRDTG